MSLSKSLSAPLRADLNPRFEAVVSRLDRIADRLDQMSLHGGPGRGRKPRSSWRSRASTWAR